MKYGMFCGLVCFSFLGFFDSSPLMAMRGKSDFILITSDMPGRVSTPLHCASLQASSNMVFSEISPPQKSSMNIAPLYKEGLSGKGQILGIIEFNPLESNVPGLKGVIISSLESSLQPYTHSHMVAQVAVSDCKFEGEYMGIAPNAKILHGFKNSFKNGVRVETFSDVIQLLIREGATCVNLSILEKWKDDQTLLGELIARKGELTPDFIFGISHALEEGVPVFMSVGNDKEEMGTDVVLNDLSKNFGDNPLFQLCAGYDCPRLFFERDDVRFSKDSGRGSRAHSEESLSLISAPYCFRVLNKLEIPRLDTFRERLNKAHIKELPGYNPGVVNGDIEKYLYDLDRTSLWELETVYGTSFSAPAVAGTYLLLAEYADGISRKDGIKLSSKDLMYCLRGSAYKPAVEGEEDPYWFGVGMVDGGAALDLLKKVIVARKFYKEGNFISSAALWKDLTLKLGYLSPVKYMAEAIKAQEKLSVDAEPYVLKILQSIPSPLYPKYIDDMKEAYHLYFSAQYKETYGKLAEIYRQLRALKGNMGNVEKTLHKLLTEKTRQEYLQFRRLFKKFKNWGSSFLKAERTETILKHQKLSISVRGGDKIVKGIIEACVIIDFSILKEKKLDFSFISSGFKEFAEDLQNYSVPEEMREKIKNLSTDFQF